VDKDEFLGISIKQPRRDQNDCKSCKYTVQTVTDSDESLCASISATQASSCRWQQNSLHVYLNYPSGYDSGIVQYRNLHYLHPHQQPRQIYIHLLLRQEGGSLLITTKNTTHKYSLLSSNKDTYSHARGSSVGTTPILLTWKVFFSSVFFARPIGSVQLSVAENPYPHGALSPSEHLASWALESRHPCGCLDNLYNCCTPSFGINSPSKLKN